MRLNHEQTLDYGSVGINFSLSLELKSILLWLFVINLGIGFGAGLYEARVVIPQWADVPSKSWPNTGLMFWVYVTTIPLTLLTLANAIAAWMDRGIRRKCRLSAAAIVILEL